jgi:hypothetical protein
MAKKYKIALYSGPKDGLIMYWEEIDTDVVFFEYTSMTKVLQPDFSNFEYHVYNLTSKNGDEYIYHYNGVTPIEPQPEEI